MAIQIPAMVGIKAFLTSKKFLIPAAIVALLLAIGGGTYFYLNKQTAEKVETAVEQADNRATIGTLETSNAVQAAHVTIDVKMDQLRDQTTKDYQYVRSRIDAAPVEQKEAPVPPLIIDTLNELDRLRSVREGTAETGIHHPEVPVG